MTVYHFKIWKFKIGNAFRHSRMDGKLFGIWKQFKKISGQYIG